MAEKIKQVFKWLLEFIDKNQIAEWPSLFLGCIIGVFIFQLFFKNKEFGVDKIKAIITTLIGFIVIFLLDKNWYITGLFIGFIGHLIDYKYACIKLVKGKVSITQFNTSTQCSRALDEMDLEEKELEKKK